MSNYSFNVITIIFSTQTRPRCEFATLFPTHGLIMFRRAFPSIRHGTHTHTQQCRATRPGEKEDTVLLALRNRSQQPLIQNWTFLCFFWAGSSYRWMLLLSKCSLKRFSSSSPRCPPPPWLTPEVSSVVLCMFLSYGFARSYVLRSVCLLVLFFFGLFFFARARVWVCEVECLSSIRSWIFFFFYPLLRR